MRGLLIAAVCLAMFSVSVRAAEPADVPKTLMTTRGAVLFSDDFSQPLSKDWQAGKGKWEVVDGSIRGSELKADQHGAVRRHALPAQNVVIQYSFKLEGARATTLSINDAKGHCCRVAINANGLTLNKDSHDKNQTDKSAILQKKEVAIKPGQWHTLVVEIQGNEMVACLDGQSVAWGTHESINVPKKNLGLTVGGESVSFKDLRVWVALPNPGWESTRAKLAQGSPTTSKDN